MRDYRTHRPGTYEEMTAAFRWEVPATYNLAAVVASPDERRGNVVKAFVRLTPGQEGDDALAKELQEHVRNRLAAYAYPRRVQFVDDLPKTLTGKIRRSELRKAELEVAETGGSG